MKRYLVFVVAIVILISSILSSNTAYGCTPFKSVDPIVSTNWLESNASLKNLVILDIRSSIDYKAGHIKNSINAPFEVPLSSWIIMKDDLLLELPEKESIFKFIGTLGITKKSIVVIVTAAPVPSEPPFSLAGATRVADTLYYAGIKNVSILNGGYTKWVSDGKPVTKEVPVVNTTRYIGKVNNNIFVPIKYVENRIGKSVIVDNRDTNIYLGENIEPYAAKPGHIPTAKSLPAPLMWNPDGTFKSIDELKDLASAVVKKDDKIILYCGVGGYASSWWFVLTQVLGYKDVNFYDGSAQEWAKYNDLVMN